LEHNAAAVARMGCINTPERLTLVLTVLGLGKASFGDFHRAMPDETSHKLRHDMDTLERLELVEKRHDGRKVYWIANPKSVNDVAAVMRDFLALC